MNPKLKLALVLLLPIVGVVGWLFSLFSLLGPADITGEEVQANSGQNSITENIALGTGTKPLATGTTATNIIVPDNKEHKLITVAMPVYIYHDAGRRPLITRLSQQGIELRIQTNARDQSYDDFVVQMMSGSRTGADVVLMRNAQLDDMRGSIASFGFSQDISSLFHYAFHDYFQNKQYSFVPFAIDPLVTYAKQEIVDNPQSLDRDTIVNSSMTSVEPNKLAFMIPVLFGVSQLDISLLSNKKQIYDGYTDILSAMLVQAVNRPDLLTMIKAYSSDVLDEKIWDVAKYRRLSTKLIDRNPKCKNYPKLCFMTYGITNFAFGYLSDSEIGNQYLGGSDYRIYNFPISSNIYPVQLWGRVINKNRYDAVVKQTDGSQVSLAGQFFQEYLTQAGNNNTYLRPTLFSAFNNILATQETDLNRRYISQYKNKRHDHHIPLQTDIQYQQLIALLKGDYDLGVFLAGLVR